MFRSGVPALSLMACIASALVAAAPTLAEEAKAQPLKVFAVTGEHANKEVDYLAERKAAPTIVIFVNAAEWTRPVARYLKVLDSELEKGVKKGEGAEAVAVWLTSDPAKSKDYLPKAQMSLNFTKTALAVFDGPPSGPAEWNVDIAAQLTVVLIRDGQEQARFAYRSTNDQDVPEIVKALAKEK